MTSAIEYDIHVILPHPDPLRPQVLLICGESGEDGEGGKSGWTLPHWRTAEQHFWQTVTHVNDGVRALFGVEATTLRCLGTAYDDIRGCAIRWYELENHAGASAIHPMGGEWLGPEALPDIADANQRALLDAWFHEATDGVPPRRRLWARRGWFDTAVAWIDDRLQALGLRRTGLVTQVRTWERGCVLRVPTVHGLLYFKALPAMFGHEIPLIEALAAADPGAVVTLLAADRERRWMLMADMGDCSLDQVCDLGRWEEALRSFARLQMVTASNPDFLLAFGCPDRRIETLAERIGPFFAALSEYPGLFETDIACLRALAPLLQQWCVALTGYGIPAAVEHGDFWPGNVMATDEGYVYFDWSDSTLTHPFFSVANFLELDDIPLALPMGPDVLERLRDAYLAPWIKHGDSGRDRLTQAFELARRIGPLHQALLYHDIILPQMEARWEMENMVAFYLKMLLR